VIRKSLSLPNAPSTPLWRIPPFPILIFQTLCIFRDLFLTTVSIESCLKISCCITALHTGELQCSEVRFFIRRKPSRYTVTLHPINPVLSNERVKSIHPTPAMLAPYSNCRTPNPIS
jgi:hypothetical protein